jgi:serine protease Do
VLSRGPFWHRASARVGWSPTSPFSPLVWLWLGLLLAAVFLPAAPAQETLPTSLQRGEMLTPERRAALQRTLARNAAVVDALAESVKAVAELIRPTVVHIEADINLSSPRRPQMEEAGSGVIVKFGGAFYVLTNWHVIQKSTLEAIKITLADKRQIRPSKVWKHPETDIAVLAVSAPGLVAAELGDSDRMAVGDFVVAMGSPFGLDRSLTYGIISAKGRHDLQLGDAQVTLQDFIQTDASIHPGNSGGPLVNLRGEVVGINTAIASNSGFNEGVGFAIPANMVKFFSRQLIERGEVARAFLGVRLDSQFAAAMATEAGLPRPMGARVVSVTKGAPAEAAGLKAGDIIVEFNDVQVTDDDHLINLVSLTNVGSTARLLIFRDGKSFPVEITVENRDKFNLAD